MNIYRVRYIEKIKKEMKEVLFKYDSFHNYEIKYYKVDEGFPKDCFVNNNTLELISTCVFSLKHGRHPIILGNCGIGKKLLACKLGDYYNEYIAEKDIQNNEEKISSDNMNSSSNMTLKGKILKKEEQSLYIVYYTKSIKVED